MVYPGDGNLYYYQRNISLSLYNKVENKLKFK